MNNFQDVRIIFTASNSRIGKLIRWFTKSNVSHVMVEFPCWDRRVTCESTVGGVRIVPSSRSCHDVVSEFKCNFSTKSGLEYLLSKLGTEYDYSGVIAIAWYRIIKNFVHTKVSSLLWSTKAVKCSDLVAAFINSCDIDTNMTPLELITPEDLLIFCSSSDKFEVIK